MFNALLGISTFLGSAIQNGWDGFYGNRSDHYVCAALRNLHERITPLTEPRNHLLQRALRKSYLETILLLCNDRLREIQPSGWRRFLTKHLKSDAIDAGGLWSDKLWEKLSPADEKDRAEFLWLCAVIKTVDGERSNIDKIEKPLEISSDIELFLQPEGKTVEARVNEMRDKMQTDLIKELKHIGSANLDGLPDILQGKLAEIPPHVLEMIKEGWIPYQPSENVLPLDGDKRNWFECFSGFFQQKLTGELADVFQNRLLNRLIVGEGVAPQNQSSETPTYKLTLEIFQTELQKIGGAISMRLVYLEEEFKKLGLNQNEAIDKIDRLLPLVASTTDIAEVVNSLPDLIKTENQATRAKIEIESQKTRDENKEQTEKQTETLIEVIESQKTAPQLPNSIPPSVENFVGREEYLTPLLKEYQNGARCFVLHGIGGVGKTELAKRFMEKIADEYEAKIYIEMFGTSENPYSAERAMFEVVRQFEPNISADVSYDQLKGIFAQVVQQQETLIFLDNAENKKTVEDLKQAKVCLVVTSREAFTLTDKDGGKHIGMMTETDARNLLYEIAGAERFADGEADELAELAGFLPMALRPPAALLAEDEFETAGNLINRYRDKQNLLKEKVPDYYDRTVAASFELSYEKLSPEMQSRWRRLAIFPAEFDEAAIAAVLDISAEEATETQKTLRRLSLLDGNVETRRFSLHDLVREYARTKLDADENLQTSFFFARHYASILHRADTMQDNYEKNYYGKALKLIDTEWDNITTGQKWSAEFLEHDELISELCVYYCGYARTFIVLRHHRRTDIEWLVSGLRAARKIKNRQFEGVILGNLGVAYKNIGEYRKAIEYHEQYLEISNEVGDRLGIVTSLGNLGLAYSNIGEYRKAIEYHEQSLEISREIGNRLSEGQISGNLGLAYFNIGEYRKAIEYHEQSLEISREIGNLLGEGASLGNLGIAYYSLGEYQKAIEYHEQSLEISKEVGDRLGEGQSLGNLGLAYSDLREYRKAIEYHEQYLEISREVGNRLGEGQSLGNLGIAYFNLQDYRKAIEYHEQSLEISREIGNRLGEGSSLSNLGHAFDSLGEREKACVLWKESLVIFEFIEAPIVQTLRQWIAENCGSEN